MVKISVKFQENRNKTVGGVAHTRYILLYGDRRVDIRKDRRTERWKAKNYVPPLFFEKAGDKEGQKDGRPKTMSLCFSSKRRVTTRTPLQCPTLCFIT